MDPKSTQYLSELLESLGIRPDPDNPVVWNAKLEAQFAAVIDDKMFASHEQYYQQGHAGSPQIPVNIPEVFGNCLLFSGNQLDFELTWIQQKS